MKKLPIFWLIFLLTCGPAFAEAANDQTLVKKRIAFFNQYVPQEHPRLLVLNDELPEFREFVKSLRLQKEYAPILKNSFAEPGDATPPPEPAAPGKEKNAARTAIWRQGYQTAFYTGIKSQQYALSYLVFNDEKYGREAAHWLIHLSQWDINGGIDPKKNDEAFIQSLRPMLFAYDWAYQALTPDEKKQLLKAFELRLKILYRLITAKFSLTKPTPPDNSLSHPMRFISTLGLAGLALYHELPEAPTYLAWAYEYYLRQFPVWGGEDGGWSEGLNYWATAANQHFLFLDAMKALGLQEIFAKKFFQNTAYFGLYNLQPYPASSFGDLCNIIAPNTNIGLIFEKYALIYQDPYLLRYCRILNQNYPAKLSYYEFSCFDSIFHLYRKSKSALVPGDLAELPRSRFFKDIGWVAFHSELGDKEKDVMFALKSSPYGSASHSFSDQNSFVVNAFGEPLAISSGYREWSGSPHHLGWTRTTNSKNAITLNGKGQPIKDPTATGAITRFFTGANFDFTTGDAAGAYYNLNVTKMLRHVLFVNRRYFFILDEVEAKRATSHQWLLHAKNAMKLNPEEGEVLIEKGAANLLVRFLLPAPADLKFSQTNEFTVPVHPDYAKKMKNEWHFTADAFNPQKSRAFLTWLYPYPDHRTGSTPEVQPLKTAKGFLNLVKSGAEQELVFLAREAEREVISAWGILKGMAGIVAGRNNIVTSVALIDGTELATDAFYISADTPLTLEGTMNETEIKLTVQAKNTARLKIKLPFAPKNITGIGRENWSYAEQMLTLITGENTIIINR
ncbi:MAG: DUF4962 domain-containing protein [Firmicutes bacterium]|nr:DUF4962 domain-containing protein [Bacillota bacterium]